MFQEILAELEYYRKQLKAGERILISVTEKCGCDDKGCKICRGTGWITEAKTLWKENNVAKL